MLYLKKLLQDNNIKVSRLTKELKLPTNTIQLRINKKIDFNITLLEDIKNYLVKICIISNDFDIGKFLEEVEE